MPSKEWVTNFLFYLNFENEFQLNIYRWKKDESLSYKSALYVLLEFIPRIRDIKQNVNTLNKALTNILNNAIELNLDLEVQDCESIYTLVFHVHRPIAVAAAEFLNNKLFVKEKFVILRMVENFNGTYTVKR